MSHLHRCSGLVSMPMVLPTAVSNFQFRISFSYSSLWSFLLAGGLGFVVSEAGGVGLFVWGFVLFSACSIHILRIQSVVFLALFTKSPLTIFYFECFCTYQKTSGFQLYRASIAYAVLHSLFQPHHSHPSRNVSYSSNADWNGSTMFPECPSSLTQTQQL